jgi:hypothetical protein
METRLAELAAEEIEEEIEEESPPESVEEIVTESGEEIHPVPHDETPQEVKAEKQNRRRRFFI